MAKNSATVSIRVRFFENRGGEQEILHGKRLFDKLNNDQHKAVALAKASVPVDKGGLRDGIVGEVIETPAGMRARVRGKDWKTLWFEKGSVKVRAHHMLRRSLEAQGYVVKSSGGGDA